MLDTVTNAVWALYLGFAGWTAPDVVKTTVLGFTAVTSFILTGFTAGSRMFTMPLCFVLLYLAGLFTNYVGRGIHFAGATEMQTAIVLAMVGQVVAGFLLLLALSPGESKTRRR